MGNSHIDPCHEMEGYILTNPLDYAGATFRKEKIECNDHCSYVETSLHEAP